MATAIGDLRVRLGMDTRGFRKGTRGAAGNLRVMSGAAGMLTRQLGVLSGAAGIGGASVAFIKMGRAANAFEGAMNRSVAIMTGVNATIRDDMERTALVVASATKFSAREAADAYFFLASAGLDAAQSMASLMDVAKFAQAGNFDLSLATDLATDALSALGLKSKDAAINAENLRHVMDNLVKANTLANASVQQFSESLTNKAGAAMKLYGIRIEEGLAVLAAWADQGVKAEDAGTRFDIVLRDLTTKAILNADAFEKLNIAVFEFGEIRNIADIVEDMERKMGKMTDRGKKATLMQLGFTNKTVSATASLIGMSEAIRGYETALDDAAGSVDKVSENQTDLDKAWAKMGAAMQKISNEFMPPILDGFAEIITGASGAVTEIDKSADAMTNWAKAGAFVALELDGIVHLLRLVSIGFRTVTGDMPSLAELDAMLGAPAGVGASSAAQRAADERERRAPGGMLGQDPEFELPPSLVSRILPGLQEVEKESADALAVAFEKAMDKVKGQAETMWEGTRTPMEKYQARLDEINTLLRWNDRFGGGIDAETANRAREQAVRTLQGGAGAQGPRFGAAMERGSAAAFSTIINAGGKGQKVAKQQLTVAKQSLATQKELVRKFDPDTVSIPQT